MSSHCRSTLDNTDRSHRWGYMCHCWCNCSARHSSSQSVHWDRLLKGHHPSMTYMVLWHLDILIRHQWSVLFLFVNLVSVESVRVIRLHLGSILSLLEFNPEAFVTQHGQLTLVAQCTSEARKTITLSGDMVTRSIAVDTLRTGLTAAVTKVTRRADYRKAGEKQKKFTIRTRFTHVTE